MKINIDKKKFLYTLLPIVSISIIMYTFFVIFSLNEKTEQDNKHKIKENEYKFLIKEDSGKIKVFEKGNKNPINIIDKEVEYLPEYDQNILKNGIYVYNSSDLNKILEDYED